MTQTLFKGSIFALQFPNVVQGQFQNVALVGLLARLNGIWDNAGQFKDGVVDVVSATTLNMIVVFSASLDSLNGRLTVQIVSVQDIYTVHSIGGLLLGLGLFLAHLLRRQVRSKVEEQGLGGRTLVVAVGAARIGRRGDGRRSGSLAVVLREVFLRILIFFHSHIKVSIMICCFHLVLCRLLLGCHSMIVDNMCHAVNWVVVVAIVGGGGANHERQGLNDR